MTHILNKLDIVTDLRRCLYSSYSDLLFKDENVKVFLKKVDDNLNLIKKDLDDRIYMAVKERIEKAKNENNSLNKRREDLLTASYLLY